MKRAPRPEKPSDFSLSAGNLYRLPSGVIRMRVRGRGPGFPPGGRLHRSLDTDDERLARRRAWETYARATGEIPGGDAPKMRDDFARVGDLIRVYLENARHATRLENVRTLRRVIKCARGIAAPGVRPKGATARARLDADAEKVDALPASVLTEKLAADYFAARYRAAGLAHGTDQDAVLDNSARGDLRIARAMLGPRARRWYTAAGLAIPDLSGFFVTPPCKPMDKRFTPIPPAVLEKMDAAAEDALTAGNPRLWATYVLARKCGLRSSEIAALRWHWIEPLREGVHAINVVDRSALTDPSGEGFSPKASLGSTPVSGALVDRLRAAIPPSSPHGHVLGTGTSKNLDFFARVVRPWVAIYLPDRRKRLHELRKQAGSEVYLKTRCFLPAARFLRNTPKIAADYYVGLIEDIDPLD